MVEEINLNQINKFGELFKAPEGAAEQLTSGINMVLWIAMLLLTLSYTIFTFVMHHQVKSMSANFITPAGKKMLFVSKLFVLSGILMALITVINII